jgi:CTP:molybdopterin cytidylyltransferase MocA
MSRTAKVAAVLLASGLSRRFGAEDKLLQDLGGRPLFLHALGALASIKPEILFVVCQPEFADAVSAVNRHARVLINPDAQAGLGPSLAIGARAAQTAGADVLLVALADMPFVTPAMLETLVGAIANGADAASACGPDGKVTPPSAFSAACLPRLMQLSGDTGARAVLIDPDIRADRIPFDADLLADIDTPADLARAKRKFASLSGE